MPRLLLPSIVLVFGLLGTAHSRAQDSTPWKRVADQYYANVDACWARYTKKQIKTFTEATRCGDQGAVELFVQAGYPDVDLVQWLVSQNLVIAERVDKKKITPTEGMAQRAEAEVFLGNQIQARNAIRANATPVRAAQEQAWARAREDARMEAEAAADARAAAALQAQAAAQADAERRAALMRFGAGMLAPTHGGGLSEALGNAARGYSGIPLSSPPAYPTQTTCQRLGVQIVCNSQ